MKLTKQDRELFVDAVLEDVPETDYDKLAAALVRDSARAGCTVSQGLEGFHHG